MIDIQVAVSIAVEWREQKNIIVEKHDFLERDLQTFSQLANSYY